MKRKQQMRRIPIDSSRIDLSEINRFHDEWTTDGFVFRKGRSGFYLCQDKSRTVRLVYEKGRGKNKEEFTLSYRAAMKDNSVKLLYYHVTHTINLL